MSKSSTNLMLTFIAAFALAAPVAAQTTPQATQQRSTESTPVCVATTSAALETTTAPTLTVYNPVMASTPSLTFYNPSGFVPAPLTFYTPLGQIDPPFQTRPLSPAAVQIMPSASSAPATSSQQSMPATQTIPSPGPCPPGTQVERVALTRPVIANPAERPGR